MARRLGVRRGHIDSLPEEILNHIFVLTCITQLCPWFEWAIDYATFHEPRPKDGAIVLSHVCPSWRRIAINCKGLWTHVDVVPERFHSGRIPPRTKMFLARAGGKPLSIHVIGSSGSFIICPERHSFTQFLAAIAPRTCGFTWDIPVEVYGNLCLEAIPTFLRGCVPGTLTYFAVNMGPETLVGWQAGHLAMCLDAREDALLLPITALKLHNFHYSWTSKLYRGLTEFRLTGSSGHDSVDDDPRGHRSISASALLAILESSPKLRVIQIGIHIWEDMISLREDAPVTPVLLEDLEVLTLGPDSLGRVTLMKLIQPGRKLLTFSIVNPTQFRGHIEGSGGYIAEEFFARSNVTRLIVSGLYNYIDLWNLLNLIPTVRVLALESVRTCQMIKDEDLPPSPTTLDALYVTRSFNNNFSPHVIWPLIKQVIRRHRIPKLTLWRYASDARIMSDNVYAVCPQVTVVPNTDPDPIQEWK